MKFRLMVLISMLFGVVSVSAFIEDIGANYSAGYEYWDNTCQGLEVYVSHSFTLVRAISPALEPYHLNYSYIYDENWTLLANSARCEFNTTHNICFFAENNTLYAGNAYNIMADNYDMSHPTWKGIATNGLNPLPYTGTYIYDVTGAFYETFCTNETISDSLKFAGENEASIWSSFDLDEVVSPCTSAPSYTCYITVPELVLDKSQSPFIFRDNVDNKDYAIEFTESNQVLDCNGSTLIDYNLDWNVAYGFIYVPPDIDNVTIKNCIIYANYSAITVKNHESGAMIFNNTIITNMSDFNINEWATPVNFIAVQNVQLRGNTIISRYLNGTYAPCVAISGLVSSMGNSIFDDNTLYCDWYSYYGDDFNFTHNVIYTDVCDDFCLWCEGDNIVTAYNACYDDQPESPSGYVPSYTTNDLSSITGDVIGEAGYNLKINIPLIVLGLVAIFASGIVIAIKARLK